MPALRAEPAPLALAEATSPLGRIAIVCDARGVVGLSLPGQDFDRFLAPLRQHCSVMWSDGGPASDHAALTAAELAAYFAGTLSAFTVSLAPRGTGFQQQVWQAVCAVPYGETRTYGTVATLLGNPRAARAVGHANGSNPLPILIPCHRLIGSNGSLIKYGRDGGGLEMKRWLIEHERRGR